MGGAEATVHDEFVHIEEPSDVRIITFLRSAQGEVTGPSIDIGGRLRGVRFTSADRSGPEASRSRSLSSSYVLTAIAAGHNVVDRVTLLEPQSSRHAREP